MKQIFISISAEYLKVKRSKIFLIIALVFVFIPVMISLLFYLAENPEISKKLGLIGSKADMFGQGDFNSYLDLIVQIIAILGLIGFGFVFSWIFGREYAEHTINDMLALPVSRANVVIVKMILAVCMCLFLSILLFFCSLIMGRITGIEGWNTALFMPFALKFIITSLLTIALSTPVAFFACYGKGYMLPLGYIFMTIILAQLFAAIGLGPFFPWAVGGLFSLPATTEGAELDAMSYILLFVLSFSGIMATLGWWKFADQK